MMSCNSTDEIRMEDLSSDADVSHTSLEDNLRTVQTVFGHFQSFHRQLDDFPHSFQLENQDRLQEDGLKCIRGCLQSALKVGYKTPVETARARNLLAFVLFRLKRSEEALHETQVALNSEGEHHNIVSLANKAVIMWSEGQRGKAQDLVLNLLRLKNEEPGFDYLLVKAKAELAYSYTRFDPVSFPLAQRLFGEVLLAAKEPELWLWKFGLAFTRRRLLGPVIKPGSEDHDEYRDVLSLFLDIVENCESHSLKAKTYAELAWLLFMPRSKDIKEELKKAAGLDVLQACEKALDLDENDHSVLWKCGRHYRNLRELETSRKLLERAVDVRPTSKGYHNLANTCKVIILKSDLAYEELAPAFIAQMSRLSSTDSDCSTSGSHLPAMHVVDVASIGPVGSSNGDCKEASTSTLATSNGECKEASASTLVASNGECKVASASTLVASNGECEEASASTLVTSNGECKEASASTLMTSNGDCKEASASTLVTSNGECKEASASTLVTSNGECKEASTLTPVTSNGDCKEVSATTPVTSNRECKEASASTPVTSNGECKEVSASTPVTSNGECKEASTSKPVTSNRECKKASASTPVTSNGECKETTASTPVTSNRECKKASASTPVTSNGECKEASASTPVTSNGECKEASTSKPVTSNRECKKASASTLVTSNGECKEVSASTPVTSNGECKEASASTLMTSNGECKEASASTLVTSNGECKEVSVSTPVTSNGECKEASASATQPAYQSLDKSSQEAFAMWKMNRSHVKGKQRFSRQDPRVEQVITTLVKAVEISEWGNSLALFDLACIHKELGELAQARSYFEKLLSQEHRLSMCLKISVFEHLGLILKDMAEKDTCQNDRKKLLGESQSMLLMALKTASELYSKSPTVKGQIKYIWHSFSTLMEALNDKEHGESKKLREKAKLFQLIMDHTQSLAFLQKIAAIEPQKANDPEYLKLCIENHVALKQYNEALIFVDLLQCTAQSQRAMELFDDGRYVHKVSLLAAQQSLIHNTPNFKSLFKDIFNDYVADQKLIATSSEDTDTGAESDLARENDSKKPTDGTEKATWDVLILHEDHEEDSNLADTVANILRDACGLKVTRNDDDVMPNKLAMEGVLRVMKKSSLVVVITGQNKASRKLRQLLTYAARRETSVMLLVNDGHVPKMMKTHRCLDLPVELLQVTSAADCEKFAQDRVAAICKLFGFLTDIDFDQIVVP